MKTQARGLFILFLFIAFVSSSQKYEVDAGHSSFQSKVIRFGVVPVVGRFNDVSGTIRYNGDSLEATSASIVIQTASYSANNVGGEQAVKSPAFLDAANYPEIRFDLTSLYGSEENLTAKGTLEIHGTKKEIECQVQIVGPSIDLPTRKQSIGITGALTIDRTEYGVGKEMKLPNGNVIIDNYVVIDFAILGLAKE